MGRPPSSIKLRGKVNVEGRRCKEIEILRKIKSSMEILKGHENQSMYLICQEVEVEKSINHDQIKEKSFDICFCKEQNENCIKKASKLSYDTIEKEISKYEVNSDKAPGADSSWNKGNPTKENCQLYIFLFFIFVFAY